MILFKSVTVVTILFSVFLGMSQARAEESPDLERAKAMREEAKSLRDTAERTYEVEVPQCYRRFLVNHCLDKAKAARIKTIREARDMDIEAGHLELADKQRRAAEEGRTVPDRSVDKTIPAPSDIGNVNDGVEQRAGQLRQEREAAAARTEAEAAALRTQRDAERAAARAKTEADAAERAEQAVRDRERYEERLRKAEERMKEKN